DAWYYLGLIYEKQQNWEQALSGYNSALKYNSEHSLAKAGKRRLQRRQEIAPLAVDFESAIDAGDRERAMAKLTEIIQISPTHEDLSTWKNQLSRLHVNAGNQALSERNDTVALAEFQQAQELSPGYSGISGLISQARDNIHAENLMVDNYRKGAAAYQQKKWNQAVRYLQAVVSVQTDYRDARTLLSRARREQNVSRSTQTTTAETNTVTISPRQLYDEGMAYCDVNQWQLAMGKFEQAFTLDSKFTAAKAGREYALGSAELDQDHWEAADSLFTCGIAIDTSNVYLEAAQSYARARNYLATGNRSRAMARFEAILQLGIDFRDTRLQIDQMRSPNSQNEPKGPIPEWRRQASYLVGGLFVLVVALILILRRKSRRYRLVNQNTSIRNTTGSGADSLPTDEIQTIVSPNSTSNSEETIITDTADADFRDMPDSVEL
ncbi:tetratricopeptide repeat protein, partial [bacterium]|nr:tetratricopeptide repeat protein [bacterium]